MAILNLKITETGLAGVHPRVIYIETNDTIDKVIEPGYLNGVAAQTSGLCGCYMALVSTKPSPGSREVDVDWFDLRKSGGKWIMDKKSGISPPTNEVIVNSLADFPAPVGNVITLEDQKKYVIQKQLNLGVNIFKLPAGSKTAIVGPGYPVSLTYTGTDAVISNVPSTTIGDFTVEYIRFIGPGETTTAKAIDLNGAGLSSFVYITVCDFFYFSEMIRAKDTLFTCVDTSLNGFGIGVNTINGGFGFARVLSFTSQLIPSTFYKIEGGSLGAVQGITVSAATFGTKSGDTLFDIDAAYPGVPFLVDNSVIGDPPTFFAPGGIDEKNDLVTSQGNRGIPLSLRVADGYLGAAQTIPITVTGQYELVAGVNWIESPCTQRFTVAADGTITYNSVTPTDFKIIASATIEKDGGGSGLLNLAVGKNGTPDTSTAVSTENNTPTSLTSQGVFRMSIGDTLETYVGNFEIGNTDDITVLSCKVIVTAV